MCGVKRNVWKTTLFKFDFSICWLSWEIKNIELSSSDRILKSHSDLGWCTIRKIEMISLVKCLNFSIIFFFNPKKFDELQIPCDKNHKSDFPHLGFLISMQDFFFGEELSHVSVSMLMKIRSFHFWRLLLGKKRRKKTWIRIQKSS